GGLRNAGCIHDEDIAAAGWSERFLPPVEAKEKQAWPGRAREPMDGPPSCGLRGERARPSASNLSAEAIASMSSSSTRPAPTAWGAGAASAACAATGQGIEAAGLANPARHVVVNRAYSCDLGLTSPCLRAGYRHQLSV